MHTQKESQAALMLRVNIAKNSKKLLEGKSRAREPHWGRQDTGCGSKWRGSAPRVSWTWTGGPPSCTWSCCCTGGWRYTNASTCFQKFQITVLLDARLNQIT